MFCVINFQHCSSLWPPQQGVNPARALRDPQASQEHQDPKAPWGLQVTLAGVAALVIQDPLGCRVLQALKVTWDQEGSKEAKEKVTADLQDHLDCQGFKVLVDSMELATRATREFLESQDHPESLVNGVTRDFRGFVIFPCVIRRTTSENITAKDPTSDGMAVWKRLLLT